MKDNKEFINGIYSKYEEYLKDNVREYTLKTKKRKKFTNIFKIMSSVAVILILCTLIIDKDTSMNLNNKSINTYIPESSSLSSVETFSNFYQIINDYSASNNIKSSYGREEIIEDSVNASQSLKSETSNKESVQDYSVTNNQVSGVEEADIVKTDGNNIYYVTNNKLVIINTKDPNDLKEIYKEDFTDTEFRPQEIYISNNKLIVLGNTYISSRDGLKTSIATLENSVSYNNKTKAIIYNLEGNIEKVRQIDLTGTLSSSRMIGDSLYIVSNQYINTYSISTCKLEDLSEEQYKPVYKDTVLGEDEKKIDFSQIQCFDDIVSANYLTIAGLNINNNNAVNVKTFLGSGGQIYVSDKNMYIAKQNMNYDYNTREVKDNTTTILKFGLDNSDIEYKAEAEIPGYINNQFSMDENNGTFRIATTIGMIWNVTDSTTNSLYILDEDLKQLGKIEGLAPGERIYSVRYTDTKAYIVTYKEVDPLFVIDLTDSKNPTVLGELKIEGYSTYLHPYDENHLIGFGYDTTYNGKTTTTNGLKMAMFDITDLSNPKELFKVKIGDKYTSSTLLYNHKALLFSKEKNIIGFPLNMYGKKSSYKAQIYNIDFEKGFVLKGEILQKSNKYTNQVERIIYIGNNYYVLSQSEIKSVDMETLKELHTIEI